MALAVIAAVPATASAPKTLFRATLTGPGSSDATGKARIYRDDDETILSITGRGLKPTTSDTAYAVWVREPRYRRFLGFIQERVRKDGKIDTEAMVTTKFDRFDEILLTREKAQRPKRPGEIALEGDLRKAP